MCYILRSYYLRK